jgi:membrane-bound inhibitor of C-type lysozyme
MTGMCTFADGSMCEEWALFRGECDIEGVSKRAVYTNDTETATAIYRIKESTVVVTAPAHNLDAVVIPQAMSASGARYATTDGHLEFWEHQGEGMLSIDNVQVFTGKIQ